MARHTLLETAREECFILSRFVSTSPTCSGDPKPSEAAQAVAVRRETGELVRWPAGDSSLGVDAAVAVLTRGEPPLRLIEMEAIVGCVLSGGSLCLLTCTSSHSVELPYDRSVSVVEKLTWIKIRLATVHSGWGHVGHCPPQPALPTAADAPPCMFSETLDLTVDFASAVFETANDDVGGGMLRRQLGSRYCWNARMLRLLVDADLHLWCTVLVHGSVTSAFVGDGLARQRSESATKDVCPEVQCAIIARWLQPTMRRGEDSLDASQVGKNMACEAVMWARDTPGRWGTYAWHVGDLPLYTSSLQLDDTQLTDEIGGDDEDVDARYTAEAREMALELYHRLAPQSANDGRTNSGLRFVDLGGSSEKWPLGLSADAASLASSESLAQLADRSSPLPTTTPETNLSINSWTEEAAGLFGIGIPDGETSSFARPDDIDLQALTPMPQAKPKRNRRGLYKSLLGGVKTLSAMMESPPSTRKQMGHAAEDSASMTSPTLSPQTLFGPVNVAPEWLSSYHDCVDSIESSDVNVSVVKYPWDRQVSLLGINDAAVSVWAALTPLMSIQGVCGGIDEGVATKQRGQIFIGTEPDVDGGRCGAYYVILRPLAALVAGVCGADWTDVWNRSPRSLSDIESGLGSEILRALTKIVSLDLSMSLASAKKNSSDAVGSRRAAFGVDAESPRFHIVEDLAFVNESFRRWDTCMEMAAVASPQVIKLLANAEESFCLQTATPIRGFDGAEISPEALFTRGILASIDDVADSFDALYFLKEHCEPRQIAVTVPGFRGLGCQPAMLEVWGGLELESLSLLLKVALPSLQTTTELLYTVKPWCAPGRPAAGPHEELGRNGARLCRLLRVRLSRSWSVATAAETAEPNQSTMPPERMRVGSLVLLGHKLTRTTAMTNPDGFRFGHSHGPHLATTANAETAITLLSPRKGNCKPMPLTRPGPTGRKDWARDISGVWVPKRELIVACRAMAAERNNVLRYPLIDLLQSPETDEGTLISPSPRSLLFCPPTFGSWPGWRYGGSNTKISFSLALERPTAISGLCLRGSHTLDHDEFNVCVSIRHGFRLDELTDPIAFKWRVTRGQPVIAEFSNETERDDRQLELPAFGPCRVLQIELDCGDTPASVLLLQHLELTVDDSNGLGTRARSPSFSSSQTHMPFHQVAESSDTPGNASEARQQDNAIDQLVIADGTVERVGTQIQLKLRKERPVNCLELRVTAYKGAIADARLARTIQCSFEARSRKVDAGHPLILFDIPIVRRATTLYYWFPEQLVSAAIFETLSSYCDAQLTFRNVFDGLRPTLCYLPPASATTSTSHPS